MADPGREAIRLATIAGGALSILTGAILLIWPGKTLLFVAVLIGVWLIAIGLVRIVQSLGGLGGERRPRNTRLLLGLAGLLYTIVGAVCLRDLFETLTMLSVIIGLVWIVGGVAEIAWRAHSSIVLGVLSIVAGAAVLIWPEITLTAMAIVAGLWLVALGVLQLVLGIYRPEEAS